MCLYRQFSFVLVVAILASAGLAIAAAQSPRLQIDGPEDNKITITLRDVPEPIMPEPIVSVGGITAKNVPGSLKRNPDNALFFAAELPADIKPGKTTLSVEIGGEIIRPEPLFDIPDPLVEAGKQPTIMSVSPQGGLPHDTVKITGKNFGDKVDQVSVLLGDISSPFPPVALTHPDRNGLQELVFAIPYPKPDNGILGGRTLYHYADLTVTVHDREANWKHLTIVHPKGLWKLAGLSLALCLTFLAPLLALLPMQLVITAVGLLGGALVYALIPDLFWIIPAVLALATLMLIAGAKKHYESWQPVARTLFLDKVSNTYSLSKCQAFAWTVVLIGSYLYFALGRGLLLGTEAIPDFNVGLLGLLTISYGGLVLARGINSKSPKNDLAPQPPRLSNLITEGGIISITRLQLVGFTLTAIVIYLYYVCGADLFANGLPDIPPTLNGLLAVSQGGYLGGKIVGDMAVNPVLPMGRPQDDIPAKVGGE
jgi:hypothetical protein